MALGETLTFSCEQYCVPTLKTYQYISLLIEFRNFIDRAEKKKINSHEKIKRSF